MKDICTLQTDQLSSVLLSREMLYICFSRLGEPRRSKDTSCAFSIFWNREELFKFKSLVSNIVNDKRGDMIKYAL